RKRRQSGGDGEDDEGGGQEPESMSWRLHGKVGPSPRNRRGPHPGRSAGKYSTRDRADWGAERSCSGPLARIEDDAQASDQEAAVVLERRRVTIGQSVRRGG